MNPQTDSPCRHLSLCLWLVAAFRHLVPRRLRADWSQEWKAEIVHHFQTLEQDAREGGRLPDRRMPRPPGPWEILRRTVGAFWHALWLRRQEWSVDTMFQDLRFALRTLLKEPRLTVLAAAVLALGIGANTAIFSVVYPVLIEPMDFEDPSRLVLIRDSQSIPNIADWAAESKNFESLGGFAYWSWSMPGDEGPIPVRGGTASASFFSTLRPPMKVGRVFSENDDREGGPRVAIISAAFWKRVFAADPTVVGQTVTLNQQSHTILGVMAHDFTPDPNLEVWTPIHVEYHGGAKRRAANFVRAIGRLKDGVGLAEAQAELDGILARLEKVYPEENRNLRASLVPLHQYVVEGVRPLLLVLLGAVGIVLLIACTNAANLFLVRATGRNREIGIRMAMGAGRGRIVRQLLTESLLLGLMSCAGGLVLAYWGLDAVLALAPTGLPRASEVHLSGPVLGFTLALSLLTGVLFGLAPAWVASRADLQSSLQDGQRSSAGSGRKRLRSTLAVVEIALAVVLLMGAALLVQSFSRIQAVDLGFEPRNVMTVRVNLPSSRYGKIEPQTAFTRAALERLSAVPGVETVGVANYLPLDGEASQLPFRIDGRPEPRPEEESAALVRSIDEAYFQSMGIPLLTGRGFTAADNENAPLVAIVNQAAVRTYFPDRTPIGERVRWNVDPGDPRWLTVVGVVGDVKALGLEENDLPAIYTPYPQRTIAWIRWLSFVLKVRGTSQTLTAAVRGAIAGVDGELAIRQISSMPEMLTRALAPRRFSTFLFTLFAGVALVLAVVGIYGVMSSTVVQRMRELGVRIAFGARPVDVLRLVLGQGLKLAVVGVSLGLIGAFVMGRALQSLLYGIRPTDGTTFLIVAALAMLSAMLACYLPGRRATRIDPMMALRAE